MNQQQINYRSLDSHLTLAKKNLEKQADLYYAQKHFKIGDSYNRHKFLHSQLYVDMLCTEDCDIINWLDKKDKGILDGKIVIKTLESLEQDEVSIYNTNNYYYNTEANFETVEW